MKGRLSILYFLQFGVWGCYLTSLGQFLGAGGLGSDIAWFYAAIGIVSIITPSLFGRLADRMEHPRRLLSTCHLTAAVFMLSLWQYAARNPQLDFCPVYMIYLGFLAFYMPTMALANMISFRLIEQRALNPVTEFPHIRIWGTVGFVAAMWFVNSAYLAEGGLHFTIHESSDPGHLRFQYNEMQLLCSATMGLLAGCYALTLPALSPGSRSASPSVSENGLFTAVRRLMGSGRTALFLIFVIFSGVCLQISNGFVTPYITHFTATPAYAGSLAAGNATMLFSLSQISEALCILLVGPSMKRKGIRWVYAIGLTAWSLRFLMLGLGDPAGRLWLLIGSMLVYGIAFNFITIAGHLYIQQIAPPDTKGLAQGVMMLMSNGVGATSGIMVAGAVVNHWCSWTTVTVGESGVRLFVGDWIWPWSIFAAYALAVAVMWIIFFRKPDTKHFRDVISRR